MNATVAVMARNLLNFVNNRTRLIFSLIMPFFFLFIFSFVMQSSVSVAAHPMNYLISGIIIMTVFQTSLNNAMDIINDIASGFMKEILVSPIQRWQISMGQVFSSTIIAMAQGIVITLLGVVMGLALDAAHLLAMLGIMAVTGFAFSSLGLFLATVAKNSTSFQVIISMIVMPLTFLSGAYIPTTVLPGFLVPLVLVNPLTHVTSLFRFVSMQLERLSTEELLELGVAFRVGDITVSPLFGLFMIGVFCALFFFLSVKKFGKADFSAVKPFRHRH